MDLRQLSESKGEGRKYHSGEHGEEDKNSSLHTIEF